MTGANCFVLAVVVVIVRVKLLKLHPLLKRTRPSSTT